MGSFSMKKEDLQGAFSDFFGKMKIIRPKELHIP